MEREPFPSQSITGGPVGAEVQKWPVRASNPDLTILRESGCTVEEKPFLYLFYGKDRAGPGTGAKETHVAEILSHGRGVVRRNGRRSIPLFVAHSHRHDDHTCGDAGFAEKHSVAVVPLSLEGAEGLRYPALDPDIGAIDLGGRVEVIANPEHDPLSAAFDDRGTGIFLHGDSVYPRLLYGHELLELSHQSDRTGIAEGDA